MRPRWRRNGGERHGLHWYGRPGLGSLQRRARGQLDHVTQTMPPPPTTSLAATTSATAIHAAGSFTQVSLTPRGERRAVASIEIKLWHARPAALRQLGPHR